MEDRIKGYAYVEAETKEEAIELYNDGESIYEEFETDAEEICEFFVEMI